MVQLMAMAMGITPQTNGSSRIGNAASLLKLLVDAKPVGDLPITCNLVCLIGIVNGILPGIPPKANRKKPPECDFKAYKDRNLIERVFNGLKQFRRIATRFDKTAKSLAALLALAAARIWTPHFVNGA